MELVSLEKLKSLSSPELVTKFPLDNQWLVEMRDILDNIKGIGLSANQVGINLQFFLVKPAKNVFVVCNPVLTPLAMGSWLTKEGCLSLPNQFFVVPRFYSVKLEGQDEKGEPIKWNLKGLMAQICQHEVHHLLGYTIQDIGGKMNSILRTYD